MTTPVCAVLNMKGGVGKTTLTTNVFRQMFTENKTKILLVDMDPQYNLTQQLISQDDYDDIVEEEKTALRMFEPVPVSDFFSVNVAKDKPPKANEVSQTLRYFRNTGETLELIAGTFDLTKYSFIEDNTKLSKAKKFFERFISSAKNDYDLVVLDMNPSSSFLTFAGLSVATDVLSPVRPDKFSMLGLRLVRRLLDHPLVNDDIRLHIVMNGVGRNDPMTNTETEIRNTEWFKDRILTNRVYLSGVLTARTDHTGFAIDRKVAHKERLKTELRAVEAELRGRMGL